MSSNAVDISGVVYPSFKFGLTGLTLDTSLVSNITWVLPATNGSAGQVLTNDGSGNLSWSSASGLTPRQIMQYTSLRC